jgi:hypothetical protein
MSKEKVKQVMMVAQRLIGWAVIRYGINQTSYMMLQTQEAQDLLSSIDGLSIQDVADVMDICRDALTR